MTNFRSFQDGPPAQVVASQALSSASPNTNNNYNKKKQQPTKGDNTKLVGQLHFLQHQQSSHRMARSSSNQRATSAVPTSSLLLNNHQHSSRYLSRQNVVDQTDPQQQRRRSSNNNHHGDSSNSQTQQEVWNSIEDLFWDHMREVQNKWNTLKMNDDIWAKLIYFEQNRRLAKAYVSAPVLTIDGSTNGLDGFRIGLSGIDNSYRGLDSIACLRSIGQGIKLKIDSQGNILMRKIGPAANTSKSGSSAAASTTTFEQCSVWVKDWPSISSTSGQSTSASLSSSSMSSSTNLSSSDLSSSSLAGSSSSAAGAENWHMKEIDEMDVSYKIFDMNKFRQQLERRRHLNGANSSSSLAMDWRQCVSIISFVRTKFNEPTNNKGSPQKTILRDPCWLMLINIIAIDMLKSSIREDANTTKPTTPATTTTTAKLNPQQLPKPDYLSPLELSNIPHRPKLVSRVTPTRQNILDYEPFLEPANNHHTKHQLRASSSIASLYSPTQQQQKQQQQQPIYRSSQVDLDRLSRLNNIRYGANRFLAGGAGLGGARPYSNSTQHLGYSNDGANNNVIYTTFTGKYTNNQMRPKRSSVYLTDYSSTSDYNSTTKSSNYARNNNNKSLREDEQLENSNDNQLYPIDRQANKWQQAMRPYELSSRSKSQSLSNFDWSHYHNQSRPQNSTKKPLDLRSMKTSSIKMNFDEDNDHNEDGNDDHHLGEDGPADRQVTAGIVSRMAHRFGREPLQKRANSSGRRAVVSMNKQMSNWPSRSSRKDGYLEQTSQDSARPTKHSNMDEPDVINEEEGEQLDLDEEEEEQENGHCNQDVNGEQQTKLAKLKVSRSSIASTHSSSSSGCPENDYFISNSSSSMSSSTGSQECELFSQPASSSGIVCSGNTSDEYEMEARNKRQQQVSSNGAKKQSTTTTSDNDGLPNKNGQELEQATDPGDNIEMTKKHLDESDKKESQLNRQKLAPKNTRSKQHIRSISRNRCYNVKTVDLDGEQTDDIVCGHHHNYNNQQSCDCDELANGGGKERPAALDDDANACDCCCDCFVDIYQTPPPIEANVQVDRCDCGHLEPSDNQFQDHSHESIYERLPHPGKLAYAGTRGKISRRSINNDLANTLDRSASAMANVNEEDAEYDDIQAIPFSTSSSQPPQQIPLSEDPKRSTHKDAKSSWLERRKYIKLFPKFMFSSSTSSFSSSSSSSSPSAAQQANNNMKQTRPTGKSGTLDNSTSSNKFRRTRSSQNLTR